MADQNFVPNPFFRAFSDEPPASAPVFKCPRSERARLRWVGRRNAIVAALRFLGLNGKNTYDTKRANAVMDFFVNRPKDASRG